MSGGDLLTTGGAGKSLSTRAGSLVEGFDKWCLDAAALVAEKPVSSVAVSSWSGLRVVREGRQLGAGV